MATCDIKSGRGFRAMGGRRRHRERESTEDTRAALADILEALKCHVCNAVPTRMCACDFCGDVVCQAHAGHPCDACDGAGTWRIQMNGMEEAVRSVMQFACTPRPCSPPLSPSTVMPLANQFSTIADEIQQMAKFCCECCGGAFGIMQIPVASIGTDGIRKLADALDADGVRTGYDPKTRTMLVVCDAAVSRAAVKSTNPAERGFYVCFRPFDASLPRRQERDEAA